MTYKSNRVKKYKIQDWQKFSLGVQERLIKNYAEKGQEIILTGPTKREERIMNLKSMLKGDPKKKAIRQAKIKKMGKAIIEKITEKPSSFEDKDRRRKNRGGNKKNFADLILGEIDKSTRKINAESLLGKSKNTRSVRSRNKNTRSVLGKSKNSRSVIGKSKISLLGDGKKDTSILSSRNKVNLR